MAQSSRNSLDSISVKGAKAHNLKNISVRIPRDSFTVITGPSGSGKSSLAFDTIYAEGQRRYVESLNAYARQFLEQVSKPDVESIEGLSPTISIDQKTTTHNPRSTVGTVTEVYDYIRLLYARIAKPFCYNCSRPIQSQTQQQITDHILSFPEGTKLALLAPVVRGRKGEYQKELHTLRHKGFVRVRVDGKIRDLSEEIKLDRQKKHSIEVYVDRIVVKGGDQGNLAARLSESVELSLKLGEGLLILEEYTSKGTKEVLLSEKYACVHCNISYPEPEPRTFSFNSPVGACPDCDGLGFEAFEESEDEDWEYVEEDILVDQEPDSCPTCLGARLRKESLCYKLGEFNIAQLCDQSIVELVDTFKGLSLTQRQAVIAQRVVKEILERLEFLNSVGVGYLSLSRSARTLSGGETQRIRLATQIGSSLVDVIYVLDEPSIGLHPRDHSRLLETLYKLRDLGNTVLVVEHDRETIENADFVIDLGPGAGTQGGEIVAEGSIREIQKNKKSLTGLYLSGAKKIDVPSVRRAWSKDRTLRIVEASKNNLKKVTAEIPLGVLSCVTGVSGSGKSTLIIDTLYRALLEKVYKVEAGDLQVKSIEGLEHIDKVIDIDQRPIGRTPRSNPATYSGLFTIIRDLFAQLPDAQVRGYKKGRFSFNVKGGRCEECEGGGMKKMEMHFLPNVYVECDACQGDRYNYDTLDIRYKGKNIAEVLAMTASDALTFFDAVPSLKSRLKILNDVGLGYITLGQSATTLSGGEAQRIKLAKELAKKGTGRTVYILDEPSTGLHFDDVSKLVEMLHALVDQGNTVIIIEHNLDIIKVADHLLDLGPEGGVGGGQIVGCGTPEELAKISTSHTGRYLQPYLSE